MAPHPSLPSSSRAAVPRAARAPAVRRYRPADLPALYEVCLRTGWHGGDAAGHCRDARLLGDIFAGPYAALEPELIFVAEDGLGVAGHVLATADTAGFALRTEAHWWPAARRRHPLPDPDDERPAAWMVRALHQGVLADMPFLAGYPAHLHIGLLPRAQRRGLGVALIERCVDALRSRGVPGVHLGVSALNPRAIGFYEHLGFETLESHAWGRWMGLGLR